MKTYTFFGLVVLLSLAPLPGHAQDPDKQVLYMEDFEQGRTPQLWDLERGWKVKRVSGDYVLSGAGDADGYFAKYTKQHRQDYGRGWQDFRVRFRLRLLSQASTMHFNYRLSNKGRYYIGFQTGQLYLHKDHLTRNIENKRLHFESMVALSPGMWHIVEIAVEGPLVKVFVDGKEELKYSDLAPLLDGGTIACEILPYAVAEIDDIVAIGRPWAPSASPAEKGPVHVEIVYDGKKLGHQLIKGLQHDVEINTRDGVTAFVEFHDGSEIIVMPNTHITIDSPGIIFKRFGEIFATIKGIFTVELKNATAGVVSTSFNVKANEDGSVIEVTEGKVILTPNEESDWDISVNLESGHWTSIGPAKKPEKKQISVERFDQIDRSIKKLREKRAKATRMSGPKKR